MKLLLFDVDQTLVSTGGAGIRALNRAFQKLHSMENVMDGIVCHGKTDPSIVREIFAARGADASVLTSMNHILDAYLTFLREEVEKSDTYRVLPGIVSALDELLPRNDVMLGLATGNIELGARVKLERGGLNRYFAFGGYGSDSENRAALVRRAAEIASSRSPRPISPNDVFVIGDTPKDVDAGRQAGFRTVGVATGNYSIDELRACEPTFVISDFDRDRGEFFQRI